MSNKCVKIVYLCCGVNANPVGLRALDAARAEACRPLVSRSYVSELMLKLTATELAPTQSRASNQGCNNVCAAYIHQAPPITYFRAVSRPFLA